MSHISAEQAGIDRILLHGDSPLRLNEMALPEAREMNSQVGVDSRLRRSIHNQWSRRGEYSHFSSYGNDEDGSSDSLAHLFDNAIVVGSGRKRAVDQLPATNARAASRSRLAGGFVGTSGL